MGEPRAGGGESTVERGDVAGDVIPGRPELVAKPGEGGPVFRPCGTRRRRGDRRGC